MRGNDGTEVEIVDAASSHWSDVLNSSAGDKVEDYNWTCSLGSSNPVYVSGLTTTFSYKGISVRALFTGKFGYRFKYVKRNGQWLDKERELWKRGYGNEKSVTYFPAYNAENATRFTTASLYSVLMNNVYNNSKVVYHKGDHIRLNDIYVGYELPAKYLSKLKTISGVSVFFQARNLGLVWSSFKDFDPEAAPGTIKPPTAFTFGLKFNLN